MTQFFKKNVTKDESRDTGMAMVLLFLLLFVYFKDRAFLVGAIALHVLTMTAPKVYGPVAVVWLGLAKAMSAVVSRIFLTGIFFVIVTPIGMLRRLSGHDSLKLREFKSGEESVMVRRNHVFVGADLEKPY